MSLDEELARDFAALGVEAAAVLPVASEEAFEIAPENADTLDAWLACETQWRLAPIPGGGWAWLGLDYAAVDVVLRRRPPAAPDAVFADLLVMERAAIQAFAEAGR